MLKVNPFTHEAGAPEPRLYRLVANRIQQLIRDENIALGERLPSERDLSAKLSVSRASLREALLALELGGEVEVRGGSGVYVSDKAGKTPVLPEVGPGPFEILSARHVIESEVVAIAARLATDGAIDEIRKTLLEMESSHDDIACNELADRNFHCAIARATGNSALLGAVEYLWDQRGRLWDRLKERFETDQLRQQTMADHRRIFEAIAMHDPARARSAMRAHLERVTRTFSSG